MNRLKMPPLNPAVRLISNPELARLKNRHPNLWCTRAQQCRTCLGKGWFLGYTTGGDTAEYDCPCIDQMVTYLWLLNSGIDWSYQRLTWSDAISVDPEVIDQILQYVDEAHINLSQGRGLVLWGSNGVGKTMLATLILKRFLANGYSGQFFTFTSFLDAFAAGWKSTEERDWFSKEAMNTQMLILDDAGKEAKNRSAAVLDAVDVVMQARINAALPTIITTNLTPEQIESGYGGHIFSRLTGNSTFIKLNGADFRKDGHRERLTEEARKGITRPVVLA